MRIALFTDTYLPQKNGVAVSVAQLKSELELLGQEVFVYTVRTSHHAQDDPHIYRSKAIEINIIGVSDENLVGAPNWIKILSKLKSDKIEIIHTHSELSEGLAGRYCARILKIPHVHTVHTMWSDYMHYLFKGRLVSPRTISFAFKRFLSRCTAIVAPSPKAQVYLKGLGIRSTIVNNGVDASAFLAELKNTDLAQVRAEIGITAQDFPVLFVGRIAHEKRVMEFFYTLVAAMAHEPRIFGLIVGDGIDRVFLQEEAQRLDLGHRFKFTGVVEHAKMAQYYAVSSCYATVSLSEVQPMTVIEALISGLPVLSRKDLAYEGMVQNNINGFMVDSDEEMALSLAKLAQDATLCATFATASLERASYYSAKRQAVDMLTLYEKTLKAGIPGWFRCGPLIFDN
jgi:1,2-diacylglycerol 3-alpha-glucosyltransferase